MSTLHSRLPDTGSIGPRIHSSSKGSVRGDLKLSAIFEICVHPICHKNEYTSVRFLRCPWSISQFLTALPVDTGIFVLVQVRSQLPLSFTRSLFR